MERANKALKDGDLATLRRDIRSSARLFRRAGKVKKNGSYDLSFEL
jgi:hypothetical protein